MEPKLPKAEDPKPEVLFVVEAGAGAPKALEPNPVVVVDEGVDDPKPPVPVPEPKPPKLPVEEAKGEEPKAFPV